MSPYNCLLVIISFYYIPILGSSQDQILQYILKALIVNLCVLNSQPKLLQIRSFKLGQRSTDLCKVVFLTTLILLHPIHHFKLLLNLTNPHCTYQLLCIIYIHIYQHMHRNILSFHIRLYSWKSFVFFLFCLFLFETVSESPRIIYKI